MGTRQDIQTLKDNAIALNAILNGPESGDGSLVTHNGTQYRSVRRKIAEVANGRFDELSAQVTQSLSDALPDLSGVVVYVDVVNGSDANPGTAGMPVQTVSKAIDLIPVGGVGEVRLKRGEDHVLSAGFCNSKTVFIKSAEDEINAEFLMLPGPQAPNLFVAGGYSLRNSHLLIGGYGSGVHVHASGGSFMSNYGDRGCSTAFSSVNVVHSTIDINNDTPLMGSPYQIARLRMRAVKINRNFAAPLVSIASDSCVFEAEFSSVTFDAGVVMADLITGILRDANGMPRNLLANFII